MAFEAAGRLQSFKRAAAELHRTASAVSQQIKALEEALGVTLFERKPQGLVLTSIGSSYLELITRTLDELSRGTQQLVEAHKSRPLVVSLPPMIAHELVIPNLGQFQQAHPDIAIRIQSSFELADFGRPELDLALRLGSGHWSGLQAELLTPIQFALVCAPALAERCRTLHALAKQRMIVVDQFAEIAHLAAAATGFALRVDDPLVFQSYYEVMRAAEAGVGVAVGLFPITSPWLASRRLRAVLHVPLEVPFAAYLVGRPGTLLRPEVGLVRAFLVEQFKLLQPLATLLMPYAD